MYCNGVIVASFIVGIVTVFIVGRLILAGALSYVNESVFKRPWPYNNLLEYPDEFDYCRYVMVHLLLIAFGVFAWPVALLAIIIIILLRSARFAVRTGKKLGSLKEKSHEHPESVEQSQSKFSW